MPSPKRPAADLLTFVLVALGVPTLCTTEDGRGPGRTELWQQYAVESDAPLLITLSGGDVRYRIDRISVAESGDVDVVLLRQRARGGDYARRVGMYLGAEDVAQMVDGGRDFLAAVAAKLAAGASAVVPDAPVTLRQPEPEPEPAVCGALVDDGVDPFGVQVMGAEYCEDLIGDCWHSDHDRRVSA